MTETTTTTAMNEANETNATNRASVANATDTGEEPAGTTPGARLVAVVPLALLLVVAAATGVVAARTDAPTVAQGGTAPQAANATVETDGGDLVFRPTANQTVRGETSLPAGTEVSVRVRSAGDAQPRFLKTASTTVDESGEFRARMDMSGLTYENRTPVSVAVYANGTLVEVEGAVVPTSMSTATPTDTATTTPAETRTPVPGFGPVAGGLALLAVAVVAGRLRG